MTIEQKIINDHFSNFVHTNKNSEHLGNELKYFFNKKPVPYTNSDLESQKPNCTRTCSNCGTSSTSTWRNLGDKLVCNACKCFYRKHGRSRPVHMRKDAIIPRHRKICRTSVPNEGVFKIEGSGDIIGGIVEPDSCLFAEAVCMLMKYFS